MTSKVRKLSYRTPVIDAAALEMLFTTKDNVRRIGRISWSPDGRQIACPSDDSVRIISWADRKTKIRLPIDLPVRGVEFSPVGSRLAVYTEVGRLEVWDVTRQARLWSVEPGFNVSDVAFDPTGTVLAVCDTHGEVQIWNVAEGKQTHVIGGMRSGTGMAVAFHSYGANLAVLQSNLLSIWDPQLQRPTQVRIDEGFSLAYSPDNRFVAVGFGNGAIQLRNPATLRLMRTLEGHVGVVDLIRFSPDGALLASKSNDDTVRLWRLDTFSECATIDVPKNRRDWWPGLAFHPRDPMIAVVSAEDQSVDGSERRDCMLEVLRYGLAPLARQISESVISITSAKIVIVGESNVGKSYLAHRLVTGKKPKEGDIRSTHGMKFWSLEPSQLLKKLRTPKGERREIVLWDMGGQEEYRLVHQLFLQDTVVALILIDPTRGAAALSEAETWNKYLDKQLQGKAIKILVGSKMDLSSDMVDRSAIDRLVLDAGFHGYMECSAMNGRGIQELSEAVARAIDWKALGRTSRPELFQRIRDEVERSRKEGRIVFSVADLLLKLGISNDDEVNKRAVDAVTRQLATQGLIARSRVSSGDPVLVLQVQEIERYAGSLILAARRNERGVPALELREIARPDIMLPGISLQDRLEREAEQLVIESTVQMMLEHGLCFQHEGLLIFPTLFSPTVGSDDVSLPHAVSLFYDFAGAIDNTYASLVAWLVLARDFGRVRLWADRAEFEAKDTGLCGLRKVTRSGGFAHVDVYFEENTPIPRRQEFIQFVEDHLATHGVEIREHISITCNGCGNQIEEATLRQRIARGEPDVACPVCEKRHRLEQGAVGNRARNPDASQRTWALRTQVAATRDKVTQETVGLLEKLESKESPLRPIRLLHLSDLHFDANTPIAARLQWLVDDIKPASGLGFDELDYLLISGDFTDRGNVEGFEKAYEFVSGLTKAFGLSAQRCIFVPGNHDIVDDLACYRRVKSSAGLREGEWLTQGDITLARDPERYATRLKPFSDSFFHKFLQLPYPLAPEEQGFAIPFWDTGIQFLTLNSCWQIDEFHRNRAGVHPQAVARVLREAQVQENDARNRGLLAKGKPLLRIATWHHAVTAPDYKVDSIDFLGNLRKIGVRLGLHGDVHEMRREQLGYWRDDGLQIIGCGSFGARAADRPESIPRMYNVVEISRDLQRATVHTRHQNKPDGPWEGWHVWPSSTNDGARIAAYDISLLGA